MEREIPPPLCAKTYVKAGWSGGNEESGLPKERFCRIKKRPGDLATAPAL
jgi:hypothetical protein